MNASDTSISQSAEKSTDFAKKVSESARKSTAHEAKLAEGGKGEQYNVWLNIGVAKNDGVNHIYDLTKKTEEALNQKIDSRPVGNAIENASSYPSISQNGEKSIDFVKKYISEAQEK